MVPAAEKTQLAAIYYENGVENLLITVTPEGDFSGDQAVWIFPIPATPDKVKIDILKGYPILHGDGFFKRYDQTVDTLTLAQLLYATFPVSVPLICLEMMIFYPNIGSAGLISGVAVFERIEKMGITTELVTAEDTSALNTYLESFNMTIKPEDRAIFDTYIGKHYSFVISHISDIKTFKIESKGSTEYQGYSESKNENPIGVFVRFPTDRIYYPLKPTSIYGTRKVPVLLYVFGFVSPVWYPGILHETNLGYYVEDDYRVSDNLVPFFNGKTTINPLKYTVIDMFPRPATDFTDDLWIDNHPPSYIPPSYITFEETFIQNSILISVCVYILFSVLASAFAGFFAGIMGF